MTQSDKILSMLMAAGEDGVSNKTFYQCFLPRYGARIFDLRKEGYHIETKQVNRNTFRFYLRDGHD